MRYKSVSSSNPDGYRAGIEIGDAFCEQCPEVILLFASICFEGDFATFFDGLYDSLGTKDVVIFGGTGDGIYETNLTAHYGICALGIWSGNRISWSIAHATGVGNDSAGVARSCAREALDQTKAPAAWAFVLADGVKADGTEIVAGVSSTLDIPFFGGLTGDDRKFTRSRILCNGQEIEDGVAILLASGQIPFTTNSASGWHPIGVSGIVEETGEKTLFRISGQTPQAFMREQIGKPLSEADLGTVPLAIYRETGDETFSLRAVSRIDHENGAISTFGSIEQGLTVKVCCASREQVLQGVATALAGARQHGFTPAAAIMISCAGRKWLLDECGKEEVAMVQAALGSQIPLVGFPSFGEIGPFRLPAGTYTEILFHNVTFVICLLGA